MSQRHYIYNPAGYDIFDPKTDLKTGQIVHLVNAPGFRRKTVGPFAWVAPIGSQSCSGIVMKSSLIPAGSRER